MKTFFLSTLKNSYRPLLLTKSGNCPGKVSFTRGVLDITLGKSDFYWRSGRLESPGKIERK
jgi:hypothetical protein